MLYEAGQKLFKFCSAISIQFKAQWLSGLKWRLNDLFETYSTVRGWADEAKIIYFSTSCPLPCFIRFCQSNYRVNNYGYI